MAVTNPTPGTTGLTSQAALASAQANNAPMPTTATSSSATVDPQTQASGSPTPGFTPRQAGAWTGNGGLFSRLVAPIVNAGGTTPTQTVDSDGNLIQGVTNARPGTLFKNLLVGALTGLGAAAANPGAGFGSGLGAGFVGGMQQQRQDQQDMTRQTLQAQQIKTQHEQQQNENKRLSLDEQNFKLNGAHWTAQNLAENARLDLENTQYVTQANESNQQMESKALDAHGISVPVTVQGADGKEKQINNTMGNGPALMAHFGQNPDGMKSPSGGHYIDTRTVDLQAAQAAGVKYDPAAGFYKDDKGNRADLGQFTTHNVIDVPPDAAGATISVTRAQLKSLGIDTSAPTTLMNFDKYSKLASDAQNRRVEMSGQEMQKQITLFQSTQSSMSSLAEARDKILSDPANEPTIAAGGAAKLTASIDQQLQSLQNTYTNLGTRFKLLPNSGNSTINQYGGTSHSGTIDMTLPPPPAGAVTVEEPGKPSMPLAANQLQAFLSKYPNARYRIGSTNAAPAAPASQPTLSQRPGDVATRQAIRKGVNRVSGLVQDIPAF